MAGTMAGGKLAAARNLARDPDFYRKIGTKGGRNGRTGGFFANPELARIAGAKGGRKSRRKPSLAAQIN
jgi:general stress protein YciG